MAASARANPVGIYLLSFNFLGAIFYRTEYFTNKDNMHAPTLSVMFALGILAALSHCPRCSVVDYYLSMRVP